ncbi:MAG: methyltransferase domain-containing protein [Candidatus Hydrogenedens sp.]|nr:methyltransferase domain-containing protein [Candidatus Hydrogenedens sp.]
MYIAVAIVAGMAALVGAGFVWRYVSASHLAPCPTQFTWMLENPYVKRVAGAGMLLDRLGFEPGMTLLDVGCGPGRVTLPAALIAGAEGKVIALDLQEAMLDMVRERARKLELDNIEFLNKPMSEDALPEACCDRAVIVAVLGEIPDKAAAMRGIYRALRPGGRLCVCEILPDPHYQTRQRVLDLAEAAGFKAGAYESGWCSFTQVLEKPGRAI